MFVIAWMAGILYLPRLFVYHVKHGQPKETHEMFLVMERRLVNIIVIPACVGTVITGAGLLCVPAAVNWLKWTVYMKQFFVLLLLILQAFFLRCGKRFKQRKNAYSEKFFRAMNEVPFILAIFIVFLVVLKPF